MGRCNREGNKSVSGVGFHGPIRAPEKGSIFFLIFVCTVELQWLEQALDHEN